jgi:outer membrane protein assembly factor BamA
VLVVDELACRGNAVTSCDFILGHVYLASGDILDEEELDNARLRLASLPSFQSVDVYLERASVRDHVRVVIDVKEADPYVREWLAGTSSRLESLSQLLTGRLMHQNVFGTGKLFDVFALALIPLDGRERREFAARVQYVDPHWRNSKRTFFIAGMAAGRSEYENVQSSRLRVDNAAVDFKIGQRIFDFSYLSLDYRYNALIDIEQSRVLPDGTMERAAASLDNHLIAASYGWNSEDDPYFPTRGSRAYLRWIWASTAHDMITEGGFRKTWTTQSSTSWFVQIADTPGTEYRQAVDEHFEWNAGFARPIAGTNDGEVRRGRWYLSAGYSPQGSNAGGERLREFGLKIGVRLETHSFGVVDLYVLASDLAKGRSLP